MTGLPAPIQRFMLEMQVEAMERDRRRVLADPVAHKTTLQWPDNDPPRWRYYEVKGKAGPRVRYCYTTNRNLAGYFLCFREVWQRTKGVGRRDQLVASKRRTTVADKARARYEAHKARLGR